MSDESGSSYREVFKAVAGALGKELRDTEGRPLCSGERDILIGRVARDIARSLGIREEMAHSLEICAGELMAVRVYARPDGQQTFMRVANEAELAEAARCYNAVRQAWKFATERCRGPEEMVEGLLDILRKGGR